MNEVSYFFQTTGKKGEKSGDTNQPVVTSAAQIIPMETVHRRMAAFSDIAAAALAPLRYHGTNIIASHSFMRLLWPFATGPPNPLKEALIKWILHGARLL